jgi:hypothetical protein
MKNMTMFKQARRLGCLTAVAIISLAWTSRVQAQIMITITDVDSHGNKVGTFSHTTPGTPTFTGTYNIGNFGNFTGFSVTVGATAASPFNGAELTNTQVTGTDAHGSGVDTITISVTGGIFTSPASSPLLVTSTLTSSNLSGSAKVRGQTIPAATATFTSSLSSGSFSNPSTALLSITGNGQSSQTGTTTGGAMSSSVLASSNGSFSLSNTITSTFSNGQTGTLDATTQATAVATPEPSTMAIAGLGALSMIGYGLRRRKAQSA